MRHDRENITNQDLLMFVMEYGVVVGENFGKLKHLNT